MDLSWSEAVFLRLADEAAAGAVQPKLVSCLGAPTFRQERVHRLTVFFTVLLVSFCILVFLL